MGFLTRGPLLRRETLLLIRHADERGKSWIIVLSILGLLGVAVAVGWAIPSIFGGLLGEESLD